MDDPGRGRARCRGQEAVAPKIDVDRASGAIRSLAWDIALNATIPAALYLTAKYFLSASAFGALFGATTFPLVKSAYDLSRRRDLDPVALLVLLGLVTSMIAVVARGHSRPLLQ